LWNFRPGTFAAFRIGSQTRRNEVRLPHDLPALGWEAKLAVAQVFAHRRLRVLQSELESAQRNAAAERAFDATGKENNPWAGSIEQCEHLA
jgi:hypothetical protein